jgi:hypothetical protein
VVAHEEDHRVTWLAIFKLLLTLADKIADVIRQQQLLDAGAKAEIAVQLAAIAHAVEIGQQVNDAIDVLSETEVQGEVEADAR